MMQNDTACLFVMRRMERADFYVPMLRKAFSMICTLRHKGSAIDEMLVAAALERNGYDRDTARHHAGEWMLAGNAGIAEAHCNELRALRIQRETRQIALEVLAGLPADKAADALAKLKTPDATTTAGSVEELDRELASEIAGHRYAVEFPEWPVLSKTQCLMPGALTLIAGSPGVSKSFFLLEPVWRWTLNGERVGVLEGEKGTVFHMRRTLGQMAGESNILRARWVNENGAAVKELLDRHRETLRSVEQAIQAPHESQRLDCQFMLDWVQRECEAGKRVLAIDPVTIMQGSSRRFEDHERFIYEVGKIITKHGASLICVTHPRKGAPGEEVRPCLENIPGSSAWERFCDTIFWLTWHPHEEGSFATAHGNAALGFNRTMYCLKVRLDENPGKICYWMNGKTLRHEERGTLLETYE